MGSNITPKNTNYKEVKSLASLTDVDLSGVLAGDILIKSGGQYVPSPPPLVGSIKQSILSEAQFQEIAGDDWVLADGRSAAGTSLSERYGVPNVPDLRSTFIRGKDNGRGLTTDKSLGAFTGESTSLPNSAFSLTTDGGHSHTGSTASSGAHRHFIFTTTNKIGAGTGEDLTADPNRYVAYAGSLADSQYAAIKPAFTADADAGLTSNEGTHNHTVTIDNAGSHSHSITGGDSETEPKNVTINFFVKVN